MASLNKVQLIGNLGRDPEVRTTRTGAPIVQVNLATTEKWKDKVSGELRESTEWHRALFFGRLAEVAGEYLMKGSTIYIEGKLKTRQYEDKDGVQRYVAEIHADEMRMLGGKRKEGSPAEAIPVGEAHDALDDDIPF